MRVFGRRRRMDRGAPTYSNESVVARIQTDAGLDRDTARTWFDRERFGRVIHHQPPTDAPDPAAYRRA